MNAPDAPDRPHRRIRSFVLREGRLTAAQERALTELWPDYGIDYSPRDLKFGIMESGENKVRNAAEQLLLYCYHYDPATGKYGLAVLRVMRVFAVLTLIGMAAMGLVFWRRNKKVSSS